MLEGRKQFAFNNASDELKNRCNKILQKLGCQAIDLPAGESAQKKFYRFVGDFGIQSPANVDFRYKSYRYLKDKMNGGLFLLLFEHISFWHGSKNGTNSLYLVSQPYRRIGLEMPLETPDDVLHLLITERGFLEFCMKYGHQLTIDFDNNYNWHNDRTFIIILNLEANPLDRDYLDINMVNWGKNRILRIFLEELEG